MASLNTKSRRRRYFKQDGPLPNPNICEPKKKFLVEGTRNLAFAEPPSRLPWSFSFLHSHVPFLWRQTTFLGLLLFFFLTSPSCGDRPTSLVFFFSFSRPPIFGDRPALVDSTASTYMPLYVARRK
jgi:hypothetical protein